VEDTERPAEPPTDVIAWHSLEHVDHPDDTLRRLRGWVDPGARLVIATPNLGSLQAAIGGDRWFHQDVPRHRTHFTAAGLAALVGRTGFEVTRVRHLVVEQNPLGMWQTLLNRITAGRDIGYRLVKRDRTLREERAADIALTVLLALPMAIVAVALELAAAVVRRGGTIVVEARADG
jgi:2-polyprenyl-3-methyl-5-hydroxy-6-metoxy-1,4-benzoquinol methylase